VFDRVTEKKIFVFFYVSYLLSFASYYRFIPVPVASQSKAKVYGRSPAAIVGSNPTGGMDVCCACYVLSCRGLCGELITRPEESCRLWRFVLYDQETS
jgi:hypothetical protein